MNRKPLSSYLARRLRLAAGAGAWLDYSSPPLRRLRRLLHQLEYDHALESGGWRLEYGWASTPRYRVRHNWALVAVAPIDSRTLARLQERLAAFLIGLGNGEWKIVGARPPFDRAGENKDCVLQLGVRGVRWPRPVMLQ